MNDAWAARGAEVMPWFGALIIVLGFVPLALLIGSLRVLARRRATWVPTPARLVGLEARPLARLPEACMRIRTGSVAVFEFTDRQGATRRGTGLAGRIDLDGGPQPIEVLVDPADPTRSMIDPGPPEPGVWPLCLVAGGAIALAGALMIVPRLVLGS